jgi:hypothetical protein
MKEKIYNLFAEVNNGYVERLGAVVYTYTGTDEEKLNFLQNQVELDLKKIKYFPIPDKFTTSYKGIEYNRMLTFQSYLQLDRIGKLYELFSDIFEYYNTDENPLICLTPIIDGVIKNKYSSEIKINKTEFKKVYLNSAPDYFSKYFKDNIFHFNKLINDDFFLPIKLLNDNKYYLAAFKLLLSAVDTFAYLTYGDVPDTFQKWVNSFVNLKKLSVTSQEIWELRNSLLHMTNYESRKVKSGVVRKLWISAGKNYFIGDGNINFHKLYNEISDGVENWLKEIVLDSERMEKFFINYGRIVSDEKKSSIIIEETYQIEICDLLLSLSIYNEFCVLAIN